jgi:hypothetical protein
MTVTDGWASRAVRDDAAKSGVPAKMTFNLGTMGPDEDDERVLMPPDAE